ncbi:hypothetical protein [Halobacterium sp. R2-5]|uniref:DUF7522 family protein n=1 Tax=Halobacterium sp. R2-5 TaxID=2715751 RepID=UPI001423B33F|nr:hypothetical protein [Halobacterium sp. R2-5]NIB99412.1 hypothetical protein [Halobacterium sp. R2-5]
MLELSRAPTSSEFDAREVGDAISGAAGDGLRAFVEYDERDYSLLYVREDVVEDLGGETAFEDLADELHSDYRLDFTQQELYEEIYGTLGNVRAFVVVLDSATVLRLVGDAEGLYVSLDPSVSIQAVLDAAEDVVDDE